MAKVAVVNVNEIAEDSPCARVYRQGRYSRVVDLGIHVADAAIGLRRASKNKETWTKSTVFSCCTARKTSHRIQILSTNTRTYEYCSSMEEQQKKVLGHSTRQNISNDLEPHFPTSATKSRCLEETKTAVALPHCSESTKESIAGWRTLG